MSIIERVVLNIKNKGTGAGGKNTNKNGLLYEKMTDLSSYYRIIKNNKHSDDIIFNNDNIVFLRVKKANLFKCMNKEMNKQIHKAHGCKRPDECYINQGTNTIFIIEKKFQQRSGSVCEKIQTSDFKIWQYSRTFPKYKIVYIYSLSNWFRENCKAEIEYLQTKNIPIFWGDSDTYKNDIINFLISYK